MYISIQFLCVFLYFIVYLSTLQPAKPGAQISGFISRYIFFPKNGMNFLSHICFLIFLVVKLYGSLLYFICLILCYNHYLIKSRDLLIFVNLFFITSREINLHCYRVNLLSSLWIMADGSVNGVTII